MKLNTGCGINLKEMTGIDQDITISSKFLRTTIVATLMLTYSIGVFQILRMMGGTGFAIATLFIFKVGIGIVYGTCRLKKAFRAKSPC